jgi:hypothetical protein
VSIGVFCAAAQRVDSSNMLQEILFFMVVMSLTMTKEPTQGNTLMAK